MNLQTPLELASYVMFEHFDDEAILLDIRTQNYFGLDDIGALFCEQLSKGQKPQDIFEHILQQYDVTPTQLEADLLKLIETLKQHELIKSP